MTSIRFQLAGALLLPLILCPGARAQCPSNGLAVVVSQSNATEGLSMAQLRRILLGDVRNWPDKKPVALVIPDPQSQAYKCLLSAVVRMTEAEYRRYMANSEFRGEDPMHLYAVSSKAGIDKMISNMAGVIAFVETGVAPELSKARVLRINGKQPGEPGYPL